MPAANRYTAPPFLPAACLMSTDVPISSFANLSLKPPLTKTLNALGYELPTQI